MGKRRSVSLVFLLCAGAVASCEAPATSLSPGLARIRIEPQPASVEAEATVRLDAHPTDASGQPIADVPLFWSSEDSSVARVTQTGEVTGVAPGTTRIAASAQGVSGVAALTVVPVPVASVSVAPDPLALVAGESGTLEAVLVDRWGRVLDRPVSWVSDDPGVASVSANGAVTAVAEGETRVRASSEGVTGAAAVVVARRSVAHVEVSPASLRLVGGETHLFSARAFAADGVELLGREVAWSTSDTRVLEVDGAGLARAGEAGEARLTATVEGRSGSALVTVAPKPVSRVELSPETVRLHVGSSEGLRATLRAADGTVLGDRKVVWSTLDAGVATVDASGRVTGAGVGETRVRAESEGAVGHATVVVTPVPVASVEVFPRSVTLMVGGSVQLVVTTRAADGSLLDGRAEAWSSDAPAVATVSGTGFVSARAAGGAVVTVTVEGKSASASITVTVPVASVQVSPSASSLQIGGTVQLTATLRASDGTVLTGRGVTWSSNAPGVASVSGSGLVTALGAGEATVTAVSEGRSGSATVTVSSPPTEPPAEPPTDPAVASVEVSPGAVNLRVGGTRQLSATVRAADGTVLQGRQVTWSSSSPLVASVSSSGLVTALLPGEATVSATTGGVSGGARVNVTLPERER